MAKMKQELFNYLRQAGIFKGYAETGAASLKTEKRRQERRRGYFVWRSKNVSILPRSGSRGSSRDNLGTFRGSVKQDLR